MILRKSKNIGTLMIILSVCVYLISGYFIVRRSITCHWDRIWAGYYPVLVPMDEEGEAIGEKCAEYFSVHRLETTRVEYFDFEGFASIPLRDVPSRFSPFDSRMDPYMRNLRKYFFTKDNNYSILYCRSDLSPLKMFFRLKRILPDHSGKWIIIGIHWTLRLILVCAFLLFIVAALFVLGRFRGVVPLLGIPWIPLIAFGPIQMIMIGSILFYVSLLTMKYVHLVVQEYLNIKKCTTTRSLLIITLLLWMIGILFSVFIISTASLDSFTTLYVLMGVFSVVAVEVGIVGLQIRKKARQIHTLFFHVPLGNNRRMKLKPAKLLHIPAVLLMIIAIPIFVSKITPHVDTFIPQPVKHKSNTPDSLDLDLMIPDIDDYLKHRLYQKGWLYKIPYELPSPGTAYHISTFTGTDTAVKKGENVVIQIDDNWYERELQEGRDKGVLSILLNQPETFQVIYKNVKQNPFTRVEIIVYCIAWFAIFVSGLFSYTHLTPITLYGMKAVELRRQYQAA